MNVETQRRCLTIKAPWYSRGCCMHGFTVHHAHSVCTYNAFPALSRIGCVRVYSEFGSICPHSEGIMDRLALKCERLS